MVGWCGWALCGMYAMQLYVVMKFVFESSVSCLDISQGHYVSPCLLVEPVSCLLFLLFTLSCCQRCSSLVFCYHFAGYSDLWCTNLEEHIELWKRDLIVGDTHFDSQQQQEHLLVSLEQASAHIAVGGIRQVLDYVGNTLGWEWGPLNACKIWYNCDGGDVTYFSELLIASS